MAASSGISFDTPDVQTPALATPRFQMVAVSWAQDLPAEVNLSAWVRTRGDAQWSEWQELDFDPANGPDTTAAENADVRYGTDPLYVPESDQVQVRVDISDNQVPAGLRVDLIDPGMSAADAAVGQSSDSASAATPKPAIYTRAQWGADESIRESGLPQYGRVRGTIVHHTAGTNSYTQAEVPSILRGIYSYHVRSLGWRDIGYNFLVDKWGRAWEGRYGGMDKAVVGAHATGVNYDSFGISVMGNYQTVASNNSILNALKNVIAWKFYIHGVNPSGTVTYSMGTRSVISGHRDVGQTACPGINIYNQLPTLRSQVISYIASTRGSTTPSDAGKPTRFARDLSGDGVSDLLIRPSATNSAAMSALGRLMPVLAGRVIGTGWQNLNQIQLSVDLTGDGKADIIARSPATGQLLVYSGNGAGGFGGTRAVGNGWNSMTSILAVGDFDGDKNADVAAVRADGALFLYRGDGRGGVRAGVQIGSGWHRFSQVFAAGDLDHDGKTDIGAIRSDGVFVLYRGNGSGGFEASGAPRTMGTGWNSMDIVRGVGDLDKDGYADLIGRERGTGAMRVYYYGANLTVRAVRWGSGWSSMRTVAAGAAFSDGTQDVLAVGSNGQLLLYSGVNSRDFQATSSFQSGLGTGTSFVLGNVSGGSRAEVAEVRPNGELVLYTDPAAGATGGMSGRVIGTGWHKLDLVAPAGDLNADGVPDIVAREAATGKLLLYRMQSGGGVSAGIVLGTGWQSMSHITGVGGLYDNKKYGAIIGRSAATGQLCVYSSANGTSLKPGVCSVTAPAVRQLLPAGDMTGNGRNDLLVIDTAGKGWLYPSNGAGGLSTARQSITMPANSSNRLFG